MICAKAHAASPVERLAPLSYVQPRLYWAEASPCSAARVYHFTVVLQCCGTPSTLSYIAPSSYWASAFLCSARGTNSCSAVAQAPLRAASTPFWKSALQLIPAFPRSTEIVRQMVAVRFLIGKDWQKMERIGSLYAGKLGRRGTEDIAATCYPETTAIRLGSVGQQTIFMAKYQLVTWLLMHHPPSVQDASASVAHGAWP